MKEKDWTGGLSYATFKYRVFNFLVEAVTFRFMCWNLVDADCCRVRWLLFSKDV